MRKRTTRVGVALVVGMILAVLSLPGCRAFLPKKISTEKRMSMLPVEATFPLDGDVHIYWDEHSVPFIEATSDADLAFALGWVQAHLRGAQIELLRRVSQGRLSESMGPFTVNVDAALRTIDFGAAAPDIAQRLPEDTRAYLDRYVAGINHYFDHAPKREPELGALAIRHEPYTVEDLITVARLASTDVNWGAYFFLLQERGGPHWPEVWEQSLEIGVSGTSSFRTGQTVQDLLETTSRSQSNSVAIAASKSASGAAILSNDPHLGMFMPNFWLLVGYKSPSYHCVGMTIPGLPFMAVGRNPHLAWGGTNMRGASSDLYDVSALPIEERKETIKVRGWFNRDVTIRRSELGPILTDLSFFEADEDIALRWVGHDPSDEMTAYLASNRATTIDEFVRAFEDYRVSGLNLLIADTNGNIAKMLALGLPTRSYEVPPVLVLDAQDPDHAWGPILGPTELPIAINPDTGYLASANNLPVKMKPPVGWFFRQSERIERLHELLENNGKPLTVDDVKQMHLDVHSRAAFQLAKTWSGYLREGRIAEEIAEWDGDYSPGSKGAVSFELFTYYLVSKFHETSGKNGSHFTSWEWVTQRLPNELAAMDTEVRNALIADALASATREREKLGTWGDKHKLRPGHPLSNIPVLGARLRLGEYAASGSRETILKADHDLTNERTNSSYGSQSRHISVMDDLDNNWFVLYGGQDGWLGSEHFADQVPMFFAGEYIQMPLRVETVKAQAKYTTVLKSN